ncbi:MAG: hypothetical protein J7K15_01995 [Deltaproteobacteria bacterium]|nr:hypothetical protein [Deltaproteobacteria bacterium]
MMYHDESGISVIIGTLMLILITIIAASGLALMVSGMQKEAMERESHLAAVESENLRIISIDPSGNDTQWGSVNVTIMNLNTADSRITAISLNGVHTRNYMAKDASGDLDYYSGYPSCPVVYNFKKRVIVPATSSKEICLNLTEIVINTSDTSEEIDVSGWDDNSTNHTFTPLNQPYTRAMYPNVNYSNEKIFNLTDGYSLVERDNNYTTDNIGTITLLVDGNMTNTSNYIINYTTTRFDTFPPPLSVRRNEPLTIEVITSLINIFKRAFMPPVPLAEVQFETERMVDSGGNVSYRDYLILDASESFDPDGSITEYRWAVWNNSTPIYDYNLTGMKVRPVKLNLSTSHNIEIDLEVRDDTGMVSRLSQRSGNITIL